MTILHTKLTINKGEIMEFIQNIIIKHREKNALRNQKCECLIEHINSALQEAENIFIDKETNIELSQKWHEKHSQLHLDTRKTQLKAIRRASHYSDLRKQIRIFDLQWNNLSKRIEEHNKCIICQNYISQYESALTKLNSFFISPTELIYSASINAWKAEFKHLIQSSPYDNTLAGCKSYIKLIEVTKIFNSNLLSLNTKIQKHNSIALDYKITNAYKLIGNVEGRKLDRQQMACIVKDTHNHLVIAGAGTGKTTTVVGKIKFLLKSKKYNPEEILVLSFTNVSASEMSQRINHETGWQIDASTFHKLGLNIISQVNGIVPKITQLDLHTYVKEQLMLNMQSEQYLKTLCSYLLYNRVISKSEFEFKTQAEYEEYLKLNPPVTINNQAVKSYGEMDIANFLTQNGINYIYEKPYQFDTRTSEYGQYHPDFYLPEYNIYIEYFAINRNNKVPAYFKGTDKMSATQKYLASMNWKRNLHKNNNTIMIECYAYEKFEGILLENLEHHLVNKSVKLIPKTSQELWQQVTTEDNSIIDGVVELFETVINLIKSNGYTFDVVREINSKHHNSRNNYIILSLLEPIFNSYCTYLKEHNEIDFNDMINMATQYIVQKKYVNPYKYVIIDEYQDISKARYSLLKSMRESNDFKLFCVGDDWQSIYRFAGSDISLILNFEHYWGPTEISKIETTYRFTQKLIDISGNFIMQNPVQLKKSIKGQSTDNRFALGEICGYTDRYAIEFMSNRLDDLPKGCSVFFIGRYSFDVKLLSDCGIFTCQYNNVSGFVNVTYRNRPDLKMTFITAHKSKGLQADYIFIINNKKSRMGFPSKIQDAAILNLLLDSYDQYPHAEERRLFYVALTRAKKKAFIVTVNGQESNFAKELKEKYSTELKQERFECPVCGGQIIKKTGRYGEFWGCTNYRVTGCTYTKNINKS